MIRRGARAALTMIRASSWRLLLEQESGQDLVEYALAASFIGVAGYLVVTSLGVDIFNTYQSWLDPVAGVPSIWEPQAPSGGS